MTGPLPRLPRAFDAVAEGWWRLPPRLRLLTIVLLVVGVVAGLAARSTTSPWGGPMPVQVAATDAGPGDPLDATTARWPADLVPDDALERPPDGVATRPVRAGEVLTRAHVATDLSDLLAVDEVAVTIERPLPGLPEGASLELLGTDFEGRGRRLGPGRRLAADDQWTWVAVDESVAPTVAAALSTGQVTVALAPRR